jgi:4-carboxymuconolactone decarboxylase
MTSVERAARSEETYEKLFGPRDTSTPEDDPELMIILRRLIFGEVFHTGNLDNQTREPITVAVLATNQMLPLMPVDLFGSRLAVDALLNAWSSTAVG